MQADIESRVERLFQSAKPKNPEPKKRKCRPIFIIFLLIASSILLFQTVTVTSQTIEYATNPVDYEKISAYDQVLLPENYPTTEVNFVGCAHFKTKPATMTNKNPKTI